MKKYFFLVIFCTALNICSHANSHPLAVKPHYTNFEKVILFTEGIEPIKNYDYYMKKSKSQKTIAFVLLGGGVGLIGIGSAIGNTNNSSFDDAVSGGLIALIGLISLITSAPLFVAASHNKRTAKLVMQKQDVSKGIPIKSSKNIMGLTLSIPLK